MFTTARYRGNDDEQDQVWHDAVNVYAFDVCSIGRLR